jgi:hypothetical protein
MVWMVAAAVADWVREKGSVLGERGRGSENFENEMKRRTKSFWVLIFLIFFFLVI